MTIKYRPEIDGLRAIAVIPVVLFHAGIELFSGGFVGVDVFFVISGFLISSIIISEMQKGEFSYSSFYQRRIRRILPVLCVVILTSLALATLIALPEQLLLAGNSAMAAILGLSNIYFWSQTGYFAPASDYLLFLHTWSLGVEEQFYLFLPPMIYLIFKLRLNLKYVLIFGLPVLFAIGWWLSISKPSVAFYLLPARAWELGLGVALAAGVFPKFESPTAKTVISSTGLATIILSIFLINNQMVFPGWVALLPCLGTVAVIHSATQTNFVGRLLSLPILRFIGLISYSLYLWHWPVFVLLRIYYAEPHLPTGVAIFGIALCVCLSWLTWKYVEAPFRSKRTMSFKKTLMAIGMAGVVTAAFSIVFVRADGLPGRLSLETHRLLSASQDIDPVRVRCNGMRDIADEECIFGTSGAEPDFIVVGDSHAGAIRPAIEEWAKSQGRAGTILWKGACPMLWGATKVPYKDGPQCDKFKKDVADSVRKSSSLKTVFVAGRWEAAFSGIAPEVGGSYRTFWINSKSTEQTDASSKRVVKTALSDTARLFEDMGLNVVFIGAVPEVGFDVPRILALASHNQKSHYSKKVPHNGALATQLDDMFNSITKRSENLTYISLWKNFCNQKCNIMYEGVPIYSDDDHLTYTAAKDIVGPIIERDLGKIP